MYFLGLRCGYRYTFNTFYVEIDRAGKTNLLMFV